MTKDDIIREFRNHGFDPVENSHLMNFIDGLYNIISSTIVQYTPDLSAYDLSEAAGGDLDRIGEFFGIPRRGASRAYDYTWLNLRIKNVSDSPIDIPPGMTVRSSKMTYHTLNQNAITLQPNEWTSLAFIADEEGENGNCGIGEINSCDIDGLLVQNLAPVVTGADVEDDESYRYRISKVRYLRMGGNIDAIDAAIRSLPFVADIDVKTGKIPGTIEVTIYTRFGGYVPGLSNYINNIIEPFKSAGDVIILKQPVTKVVTVNGRYKGSNDPSNAILDYIKENVRGNISINGMEAAALQSGVDEIYIDEVILYDIDIYGKLSNPIYVFSSYNPDYLVSLYTTLNYINLTAI